MRGEVPDGDLAVIIERAVTEKLERLEARRFAKTRAPRKTLAKADSSGTAAEAARSWPAGPSSRHIPAAVRRAVRERDGNRCRYSDAQGRRCSARDGLEYHHRHPFGLGGDHSLRNICLTCRAHNAYMAEHDYGRAGIERSVRSETNLETASPSQPRVGIRPPPQGRLDAVATGTRP
jgi:hypothetical protein